MSLLDQANKMQQLCWRHKQHIIKNHAIARDIEMHSMCASRFVYPTSRPPIPNVCNQSQVESVLQSLLPSNIQLEDSYPTQPNNPHNDTWFRKKKAIQTCKQQVGNKLNGIAGGPERPQPVNHKVRVNKSGAPSQLWYQCNPRLLVPSSVHAHAQRIRNYLSSTCNQLWNLIKRISQLARILTIHSTAK